MQGAEDGRVLSKNEWKRSVNIELSNMFAGRRLQVKGALSALDAVCSLAFFSFRWITQVTAVGLGIWLWLYALFA